MPLPFVEVAHLPSSSSFYSAVCQPLGLHYLTAERSSSDGAPALVFGLPQPTLTPLFQVRQVVPSPDRPLKRSRLVLAAVSQEAVREVYESALRAHARNGEDAGKENSASITDDTTRIQDFDGNTMEVVYVPPQSYPARYGGSTVRRTQSSPKEVSRIMDWNYDVAASSPPSLAPEAGPGAPPALRRSATDHLPSPRQNSQGITASSVAGIIGAGIIGAAAGAAITYAVSRSSDRALDPQFEPAPLPRRSTFPDPYPYAAHADRKSERFVDVDQHSLHKGRFPDDFAGRTGPPPPAYAYKHVLPPPSRARDDLDSRSQHSSRYSRPSVKRSTSEAPGARAPLLLAEVEHRSAAGSRYSGAPPPPPASMRRSVTYDVADRQSFVSAKSRHSVSTVRGPPPPAAMAAPSVTLPIRSSRPPSTASTIKAYNSGGGGRQSVKSYASARTAPREREFMESMGPRSHISARHVPLPRSAVGSFASARDVPLPPSVGGWDDDAGSVAPSDSISCVGSRRSARSYR